MKNIFVLLLLVISTSCGIKYRPNCDHYSEEEKQLCLQRLQTDLKDFHRSGRDDFRRFDKINR